MNAHDDTIDWRARFLQSGADEDLPIVDAHHHLFDLKANYYPWLCDRPLIPFRYGNYESICKDFLPADYLQACGSHRIVKTVLIEGEWDPRDPLGELAWVRQVAATAGLPHAMAGQVWLDREDVDEVLSAYGSDPLVKSVRHKPKALPREEYRDNWSAPGSMRCPKWRDGYAKLEQHGLMFELQVFGWHFAEAVELARAFPATKIIVNHTGLPSDRSDDGLAAWRAAMEMLAGEENVYLKISGICVPGRSWTPALNGGVVKEAIRIFGMDRCCFASNFPVDGVVARMDEIYAGFKKITEDFEPLDRLKLFHDNATRLYQL